MLSRKENLLIRPFVQQKYRNHRRKVEEASPAIDFQSPTQHPHVTLKLKKLQRERERLQEIERENQRLLTKLGQIMSHNRLENFWKEPRPNFLNQVPIFQTKKPRSKSAPVRRSPGSAQSTISSENQSFLLNIKPNTRRSSARCPTCSSSYVKKNQQIQNKMIHYQVIPEERVPWAPPKKSWNYKIRSNTLHTYSQLL